MRNKQQLPLLLLLLVAIAASDSRASSTTNVKPQTGQQQLLAGIEGGPLVRQQGDNAHMTSANTGSSSLVNTKTTSNIDSRVTMLESSVTDIKRTLDLVLDWLCQSPNENNAKVAAACNNNKQVNTGGLEGVEEPVLAANVEKVDRARPNTRSQTTDDDGWTTVGGGSAGGNKQTPTGTTGGSSGQTIVNSGPITVAELQTFTEELIEKDINNVTPQIRINRQGQTNSRATDDKAQEALVTIPSSALNKPTYVAFRALMDNYDPDVKVREIENNAEAQEINTFLNEIMKTEVMQHTEQFLTSRGKIRRPLKDVLEEIWFTMYRRAGRNEGSSGFEHSFIGELKDGKVSGFHNWIYFGFEEQEGDLDYKGIIKYVNLGNKGQIVKIRFNWLHDIKPVGSLFVGTSPELEMALYTVCFLIKPDQRCQVKLNKKKFNIQTWTQNYNGKKLIGSAYPDI